MRLKRLGLCDTGGDKGVDIVNPAIFAGFGEVADCIGKKRARFAQVCGQVKHRLELAIANDQLHVHAINRQRLLNEIEARAQQDGRVTGAMDGVGWLHGTLG